MSLKHITTCFKRLSGVVFAATLFFLSACGSSTPAVPPAAIITAPDPATALSAGKPTQIAGKVSGSTVKSVDIFINGNKYATVNQTNTPNEFAIAVPWTPEQGGVQIVQIKGMNDKGEQVVQTSVIVNAQASASAPAAAAAAPTTAPAAAAAPAVSYTHL
ncbi:MAG: Ig-like domain-containing protein, partial [Anaerolineae bacterium]|nr:Ig-like domain-containing protein [Anaerolineae bacterium]